MYTRLSLAVSRTRWLLFLTFSSLFVTLPFTRSYVGGLAKIRVRDSCQCGEITMWPNIDDSENVS